MARLTCQCAFDSHEILYDKKWAYKKNIFISLMLKINAPPPIPSERIVGRGRKKGICVCVCVTTNDGGNLTAHRILDALVDRGPEGTFVVFVYAKRHTAAIYFGTIRFFFFRSRQQR
jgi:hypothetical protein